MERAGLHGHNAGIYMRVRVPQRSGEGSISFQRLVENAPTQPATIVSACKRVVNYPTICKRLRVPFG